MAMGGYTRGILPGPGMGMAPQMPMVAEDPSAVRPEDLEFERRMQASPPSQASIEGGAPPWMKSSFAPGMSRMTAGIRGAGMVNAMAAPGPGPDPTALEAAHTPASLTSGGRSVEFPGSGLTGDPFREAISARHSTVPSGNAAAEKEEKGEITANSGEEGELQEPGPHLSVSMKGPGGYEKQLEIRKAGGPIERRESGERPREMSAFGKTYTPLAGGGNFSAMEVTGNPDMESPDDRAFLSRVREGSRNKMLRELEQDPLDQYRKKKEVDLEYDARQNVKLNETKGQIEADAAEAINKARMDPNLSPEERDERILYYESQRDRLMRQFDPRIKETF